MVEIFNVYEDPVRAGAYADLAFPGTYYLAFRDLPEILERYVTGHRALDFGCGAGRSSRFLQSLGFVVTGIDVSRSMIENALKADPSGDYRLIGDGDFSAVNDRTFDLVLSAFAFDNIPGPQHRAELLSGLRRLLAPAGRTVLICSRPQIYTHEWVSFATKEFPANRLARSGDTVKVVMKDVTDARPVLDILWTPSDYVELFAAAGLELIAAYTPLGRPDEPFQWVSETTVAPWIIYVLGAWQRPSAGG